MLLTLFRQNLISEDIGLPPFDNLPVVPRVVDALFQGLAARASGFAIVPVANMAPALQFLYVTMMYIAIYPVSEPLSLQAVVDGTFCIGGAQYPFHKCVRFRIVLKLIGESANSLQ